jgi:hypothetical protein
VLTRTRFLRAWLGRNNIAWQPGGPASAPSALTVVEGILTYDIFQPACIAMVSRPRARSVRRRDRLMKLSIIIAVAYSAYSVFGGGGRGAAGRAAAAAAARRGVDEVWVRARHRATAAKAPGAAGGYDGSHQGGATNYAAGTDHLTDSDSVSDAGDGTGGTTAGAWTTAHIHDHDRDHDHAHAAAVALAGGA